MPTQQENAVRTYLLALQDPSAVRDEDAIAALRQRLEEAQDPTERIKLRQELLDAQTPTVERYEDEFVTHAKAWADEHGIGASAFSEEGVPANVLRRAGFRVGRSGSRSSRAPRRSAGTRTRSRVTADEVASAIPKGTFTIRDLQEATGASPAVVRKVVSEALEQGRISDEGTAPQHVGPGRAPRLYKRAK